jgi:hypothetical protein
MKRINSRRIVSSLVAFVLTFAILTSQTVFAFSVRGMGSAAGEITVTGPAKQGEKPFVLVNGDPAFSGRTFLSNGTITTTESSSANVNFGKIGRISLGPGSTLTLSVSETSISGKLSSGSIRVANGEGVAVKIDTPNDAVTNEANAASRFSIDVAAGGSNVKSEKGVVRYNNGQSTTGIHDDDDDDEENWDVWVPLIVIGAAAAVIITWVVVADDDDDDVVSPVR